MPTVTSTPSPTVTPTLASTETPEPEVGCTTSSDVGNEITVLVPEIFIGDSVETVIEPLHDVDHFRLCADANRAYEISIEAGSISELRLTVFDPRGDELAHAVADRIKRESRVKWYAWQPGFFRIAVKGSGRGSYVLSVAASDYVDDHGSDAEFATEITVGETLESDIGADGDVDFFRFRAERGRFYTASLVAEPGTYFVGVLRLYGADRTELCGPCRFRTVRWTARETGDFYVSVSGKRPFRERTYTLTLAQSEPVDDHGDYASAATHISDDEPVGGYLDGYPDVDYFKVWAEESRAYQIDLLLGTWKRAVTTR